MLISRKLVYSIQTTQFFYSDIYQPKTKAKENIFCLLWKEKKKGTEKNSYH